MLSNLFIYAIICQAMCRDSRIVPGAAATEIELAKRVKDFSFKETGYFIFSSSLYYKRLKFLHSSLTHYSGNIV
jgi:T-complex protein 1 subunit theta